jgi:small subunit ribosomal protein S16
MGRKKRPFYRVVAADKRAPRDGRHLEVLGHYNPMPQPHEVTLKLDRIDYWLSVGALPSDTVAALIKQVRAGGPVAGDEKVAVAEEAPAEVAAEAPEAASEDDSSDSSDEDSDANDTADAAE